MSFISLFPLCGQLPAVIPGQGDCRSHFSVGQSSSSSLSLACPVIWVFLHSVLFAMLSSFSPVSVISLLQALVHPRFGRPLLLFPAMSTSSILRTVRSPVILITWPYRAWFFWDLQVTLTVVIEVILTNILHIARHKSGLFHF